MFFHILPRAEWEVARGVLEYAPASLAADGFVHLSASHQLLRTADRFFAGRDDLVVLCLSEDLLPAVRFEMADGEPFPHHYGPIPRDAILEVIPLRSPRAVALASANDEPTKPGFDLSNQRPTPSASTRRGLP